MLVSPFPPPAGREGRTCSGPALLCLKQPLMPGATNASREREERGRLAGKPTAVMRLRVTASGSCSSRLRDSQPWHCRRAGAVGDTHPSTGVRLGPSAFSRH